MKAFSNKLKHGSDYLITQRSQVQILPPLLGGIAGQGRVSWVTTDPVLAFGVSTVSADIASRWTRNSQTPRHGSRGAWLPGGFPLPPPVSKPQGNPSRRVAGSALGHT